MSDNQDRRRFYRITDEVGIVSKKVDIDELDDRLRDFWTNPHAHSLRNDFNYQIQQHRSDLSIIQRKHPEIGRYLAVLQQQLDLITQKLLAQGKDNEVQPKQASLSAAGIRFYSDEGIDRGDVVELDLTLLPDGQKIVIFAKVIDCAENNEHFPGRYTVSLDFEHIHESDREILIQHVHGRQLNAIGAARFSEDDDE